MTHIDPESLASSLRRLRAAGRQDVSTAGDEAVPACAAIFHVTGAGLVIADETNILRYVAASDGPGRILEKAQNETGTGPCVEAFVANRVVASRDMRTEPR